MKLKKTAAADCLECVQGVFDDGIIPNEMMDCLRRMVDCYLINTDDTVTLRKSMYETFETLDGFFISLNELITPETMDDVFEKSQEQEMPF